MATVSVEYPPLRGATVAGAKDFLGEEADGLTDTAVLKLALRRTLKGWTKAHQRRTEPAIVSAVTAADTALVTADAARATAIQARKDAEKDAEEAVETGFGANS